MGVRFSVYLLTSYYFTHYLQCAEQFYPRIPSSAGQSPDNTKNLHLVILSLCLNLTVHASIVPYYTDRKLLILLSSVECKASIVDLGNIVLKILNSIKLPSLPESILYCMPFLTST